MEDKGPKSSPAPPFGELVFQHRPACNNLAQVSKKIGGDGGDA